MPGENGPKDPTIFVESERDRERREMKEKANRIIGASFEYLREQFDEPTDDVVDLALRDMLMRDADKVPDFLKPYMGWEATEIPEDVFEETRELLKMPFHREAHSREVLKRTEEILEAMINGGVEISEEEFQLARMIAAGHDFVQKWTTERRKDGTVERVRFKGTNERESADHLMNFLSEAGFQNIDEQLLRDAFDATIPDGWDGQTVVQEHLKKDSHPVVRAIALADLGAAGRDPDSYIRGGDELFVEENLDMLHLDTDKLSEEEKGAYMTRMLVWSESQITFAKGRKLRLQEELGDLPQSAKDQVSALFMHFDESMKRAETRYQLRRGLSFEDLYNAMGFQRKENMPS